MLTCADEPILTCPHAPSQSVYKTYLDVVHVAKNDTAKTFTTAGGDAAGDAQRSTTSIFDSGDLGREEIEAKETAMLVRFRRTVPDLVCCHGRCHDLERLLCQCEQWRLPRSP